MKYALPLIAVLWVLPRLVLGMGVVVQQDWVLPAYPDFTDIMPMGAPVQISWDDNLHSWFPIYAPNASASNVDLWVSDYVNHIYNIKIGAGLDVRTAGSFAWTVNVPTQDLTIANAWVFRLTQAGLDSPGEQQISSSGFNITQSQVTSVISTTTTALTTTHDPSSAPTSSATTPVTTTVATTPAASSPTSSSTSTVASSGGISTGAKAGIGVGAAVGALGFLAIGWYIARRSQSQKKQPPQDYSMGQEPKPDPAYGYRPGVGAQGYNYGSSLQEMEGHNHNPGYHNAQKSYNVSELPNSSSELP